jgi:hypothetical protein
VTPGSWGEDDRGTAGRGPGDSPEAYENAQYGSCGDRRFRDCSCAIIALRRVAYPNAMKRPRAVFMAVFESTRTPLVIRAFADFVSP